MFNALNKLNHTQRRRGQLLARLLRGAWRPVPPALVMSVEELAEITPLLLHSGSAPLAWRRISQTELRDCPAAQELRQAYRWQVLQDALQQRQVETAAHLLAKRGLEPLLGKGWAIARLYPEAGLRSYGDLDLYAPAAAAEALLTALAEYEPAGCPLDLHRGFGDLADREAAEIIRRAQTVKLGAATLRVFGAEDHLRLLCLHMLRHGAWRPLWLCDVAVALEARPADFDWHYFLSGDPRYSDWAACAIGLAHEFLGVEVAGLPVAERARQLPRWLVPTVLRQWGAGQVPHGNRSPLRNSLQRPLGLLRRLRMRWPNGIEATVGVRGPFNELPRFPFQLGECVARTTRFLLFPRFQ
jgi:hypothetical protein